MRPPFAFLKFNSQLPQPFFGAHCIIKIIPNVGVSPCTIYFRMYFDPSHKVTMQRYHTAHCTERV